MIDSDKSELVAVFGRRRVGKTFFVLPALPCHRPQSDAMPFVFVDFNIPIVPISSLTGT